MQNLNFVALPVPEIIIRYIGILSLRYPHTSGLPCDAGISHDHVAGPPMVIYNHGRAGVLAGNPSVTCQSTIAVARNIDCQVQRSSTLILGVFRLHQIAHVGVSREQRP